MSPLAQEAGGNSEDEGKPCCENAIAHETDRKSEPACWRAATGSLMNSYIMEASKILRSTVLTSLASQTLSVRVWLARLHQAIFTAVSTRFAFFHFVILVLFSTINNLAKFRFQRKWISLHSNICTPENDSYEYERVSD